MSLKRVKNKGIVFLFFFISSFFIYQKTYGIFTIQSSQKALVIIKSIESKLVETLRYLLLAITGYQVVLQDQKEIWAQVKIVLTNAPVEIETILIKLKTIEKDNDNYTELINKLFGLLNQMTMGVEMYSAYMKTLDQGIIDLSEAQKKASGLVMNIQTLCE